MRISAMDEPDSPPDPAATSAPRRFHVSLNSSDLARSIHFYRALTGTEPVKAHRDYAKFELNDPPLVLSLHPQRSGAGGTLNHLGIRMSNSEAVVAVQRRIEEQGFRTKRQDGVECCYALQTKFWASDPDGTLWEIYTLQEDLAHRGTGHVPLDMQVTSGNLRFSLSRLASGALGKARGLFSAKQCPLPPGERAELKAAK